MAKPDPAPARERVVAADTPARLFRLRCQEWAAQPALRWKEKGIWRSIGWADYFADARAIGLALAARGCRRGDTVAILSENRCEWAAVEFGALGMGLAVTAIHPGTTPAAIARGLAESGARILFVENIAQYDKLREAARPPAIVMFDAQRLDERERAGIELFAAFKAQGSALAGVQGDAFDRAIEDGRPDDCALIVDAAGDTKLPIRISNRDLMVRIEALCGAIRLRPQSRNLAFFSLCHPGARVATLYAQLALATIVHFPEQPDTVLNDIAEVQPHLLYAPPRFWEKLHARVEFSMRGAIWLGRTLYRRACEKNGIAGLLVFPRLRASLGLTNVQFAFSAGALSDDLIGWLGALGVDPVVVDDDEDRQTPGPIEAMLRFSPIIADAVVMRTGRDALACIVLLDRDGTLAIAQERQIAFADLDDLVRAEPILALIRAEIGRVNERLAPGESIAAFRLLTDIAAGDEQAMTPRMRINRRLFVRHYASLIEDMNKEVSS